MTQQQAATFVALLGQCQQYVPPVVFAHVANTDAAKLIASIANGELVCSIAAAGSAAAAEEK